MNLAEIANVVGWLNTKLRQYVRFYRWTYNTELECFVLFYEGNEYAFNHDEINEAVEFSIATYNACQELHNVVKEYEFSKN